MRGYLSQGRGKPPSPREVAAAVGDMMHLVADANWPAIFGHLNYETDFELPSGRRPDVYDPTTGRIAEYGTPNQAMKKIIVAAMYSLEVKT